MLFFIIVSVICLIIIKYNDKKKPVFTEISLSEEITAKGYVWLSQIEGMDLSYDELREIMGDIYLSAELKKGETKGMRYQEITEGSYSKCVNQAYEGMKKAYCTVVGDRLTEEGYEGQVDEAVVNSLMEEAYGVSVDEYLKGCEDLELIPSEEELKEKYNKEVEYE